MQAMQASCLHGDRGNMQVASAGLGIAREHKECTDKAQDQNIVDSAGMDALILRLDERLQRQGVVNDMTLP